EILQQPGMFAWQMFDQQVTHLLRSEYRISRITKVTADSIEELAPLLEGVDPDGFIQTVRAFNAAIDTSIEFDPNVKDGRRTNGLVVDKTNWANPLVQPPF